MSSMPRYVYFAAHCFWLYQPYVTWGTVLILKFSLQFSSSFWGPNKFCRATRRS